MSWLECNYIKEETDSYYKSYAWFDAHKDIQANYILTNIVQLEMLYNSKHMSNHKKKVQCEEILNQINLETLNNKVFFNLYYWLTDFSITTYQTKIGNDDLTQLFVKNNLINDFLKITHNCEKCNKEIIFTPKNRTQIRQFDKLHYFTYMPLFCDYFCEKNYKSEQRKTHNQKTKEVNNSELEKQDNISKINKLKTMPYNDYLQTEHWKQTREKALRDANYKCGLCNETKNLHVHHKTYENRGCEKFEDLIVLCEECHSKHHGIKIKNKIINNNIVETHLFSFNMHTEKTESINETINKYILIKNIENVIDIKTNLFNDLYTILLIYKCA